MAHVIADRVADTSTTTGTSDFTVANSPPTGFETLNTVLSTSDTFDYLIQHQSANEWEVGVGTYSGSHVFVRTTVQQSSNADSAVNFSAGTKDVLAVNSANRIKNPRLETLTASSGDLPVTGTLTLTNTGLHLLDTNASHDLIIAPGSNITADRTLTITTGDADRTLTISASATVSQDYSTAGSPQFTAIELSHATANTLTGSSGDALMEGTILKKVGKETIFVPAGAMTSRTTNGAASGTTELATNDVMLKTLDFDTTTEEGAGFWVAMPKSWNESTVTFKAFWTAASGSGGVAWGLAAYSFSDDDAMDTAVSGQQIVTDTLLTANDMHITAESSAITIGGTPAEGDVVYFEVTREVANGSDTIAADAKLIGLHLYITSNASTDA